MNYSKSPTSHIRGSPYGKQLAEGPIHDLATVIEKTSQEDWKKRTQALASLVATIPTGSDYIAEEAWYNSPTTLRHLAWPLAELLKDLRSTVVIRACESCGELFAKCQLDARYLLKDLMPTILGLHAQTVAVIRSAVQDMVVDALSVTPCKMAMPVWLDRLKSDKSRNVREACAMYLGVALKEWTEEGYLSAQIWEQVGTALVKALRDPAPTVRQHAKRGLELINLQQPDIFDRLVENSDLVRDLRVRKVLNRIQAGEAVSDDVSVTSNRSHTSRGAYPRGGSGSVTGRSATPRGGGSNSSGALSGRAGPGAAATATSGRNSIPKTIGVTTNSSGGSQTAGSGLGPPVRMPFPSAVSSPPKIQRQTGDENGARGEQSGLAAAAANGEAIADAAEADEPPEVIASNTSFDTVETNESDLPVIASADALREYAKSRGSRRSSVLQEHFARSQKQSSDTLGSALDLDDILNKASEEEQGEGEPNDCEANGGKTTNSNGADNSPMVTVVLPEHTRIAHALLEAHKKHVDVIMETLKVEMDALKEFELIMLEEGPLRPNEDEVLEYFESVGLCVEQRAKAGAILQKKMEKISEGVL